MQQGSNAWLEWRRQGIGASEVPIIMGESDFCTIGKLWERKLGLIPEETNNWAMQRGTDAEPKIRAIYELYNDLEMPASLAEHPEYRFLRASLDGYNPDAKRIAEFKYPSKEKHALAISGKVPTCYYGQVQAQLFVTGASQCDYVSFDGERIAVVEVTLDPLYVDQMLPKLIEFWKHVETKTPPPGMKKEVSDDLFERYRNAKALADASAETAEILAAEIKAKYPSGNVYASGYELVLSAGRKTVEWTKIPQLEGVDLTPYTKIGNPSLSLKPRKEK